MSMNNVKQFVAGAGRAGKGLRGIGLVIKSLYTTICHLVFYVAAQDSTVVHGATDDHVSTTAMAAPTALKDCVATANALISALNGHLSEAATASGAGAHLAVDATNPVTAAQPALLYYTASRGTAPHAKTDAALSGQAILAPATLADVQTSANALKVAFNTHIAEVGTTSAAGAHLAADATNTVATANATDQTTSNALLNALNTALNAHLTQAGVHFHNDTTAALATANASDLPTSIALATALAAFYNAHIARAAAPVLVASTSDGDGGLENCIRLMSAWKIGMNAHLTQSGVHFHNDSTSALATAAPTDLPSLQTILAAGVTYFNAHVDRAIGGIGIAIDTAGDVVGGAPSDLI